MSNTVETNAQACQKESNVEHQGTVYTVRYVVDDVTHTVTLCGEQAWQDFLHRLFALAEEGRHVSFAKEEVSDSVGSLRETVTFTTPNQQEAVTWANNMVKQGFVVSIDYNPRTGLYTCTATR